MKQLRVGLKVWSTNLQLADDIARGFDKGLFDYVELYVVSGSLHNTLEVWRSLGLKFIIHCPHMFNGFNLADQTLRLSNQEKFAEARLFADALSVDTIIVHSGNGGPLQEAAEQMRLLSDGRICVENKPKLGHNGAVCLGATPDEVKAIMDGAGINGFVLDFSHAVCAANVLGVDLMGLLRGFMSLKPRLMHLNDGPRDAVQDKHMNLGHGSFDLRAFVRMIPDGGSVSLETPNQPGSGLRDFYADRRFLSGLLEEG